MKYSTPFWASEPSILFKKEEILSIYPTDTMNFEEKLNAITRLVLLLTLLG